MSSPLSEISDDEVISTSKSKPPPPPRSVSDDEDVEDAKSEASDAPATRKHKDLDHMFDDDNEDENEEAPRSRSASPRRRVVDDEDGDSEEEAVQRKRRPDSAAGSGEEDGIQGDDLFGEDSDDDMKEAATPKRNKRSLEDEELDSGDDEDASPSRRRTTAYADEEEEHEERVETSCEVEIGLHSLPRSSDGEVYLLKTPNLIAITPSVFVPDEFTAPIPNDPAIPQYTAATNAIRWRKSAKNPDKMESNSRIIKWSDGTLSLQIGSSKDELYDLPAVPLLPSKGEPYHAAQDSFTFLAEPLATSRLIRCFSHATKSLNVVPLAGDSDSTRLLVAAQYQKASRRTLGKADRTVQLTYRMEDPERARREAEAASKLKEKYERTRLTRELNRANGDMRAQLRSSHRPYQRRRDEGMGISAADLEGDDDMDIDSASRRKNRGGRGAAGRGRREREDEYDFDDGFVEADPDSDEEVESESSEDSGRRKGSKSKSKSSKRRAREDEDDEEEEEEARFTDDEDEPRLSKSAVRDSSEGVSDEDVPAGKHERKRRRVVVAEDSDEE